MAENSGEINTAVTDQLAVADKSVAKSVKRFAEAKGKMEGIEEKVGRLNQRIPHIPPVQKTPEDLKRESEIEEELQKIKREELGK
ncbi:MAG: hypothetical protein M1268_00050 [Patescibacteria group bacterium]|nr:hypothetical protein [Patescibacteria group bacterium]